MNRIFNKPGMGLYFFNEDTNEYKFNPSLRVSHNYQSATEVFEVCKREGRGYWSPYPLGTEAFALAVRRLGYLEIVATPTGSLSSHL